MTRTAASTKKKAAAQQTTKATKHKATGKSAAPTKKSMTKKPAAVATPIKKATKTAKATKATAEVALTAQGEMRKKRRWHPGTVALRNIRRQQRSTSLLMQKLPFQRCVREIAAKHKPDLRFQSAAIMALQDETEDYLIGLLRKSVVCALHRKRLGVTGKDIYIADKLRGDTI